ncbi:MAG TPA: DMT family transporter [Alphaproteobacteria bacterium]|nr:DMT family transporter [Alphaproteobacteria bacterium]
MTNPSSHSARTAGRGGNSALRAALYMCVAVSLFPILNASVKYLGRSYPMPEIFWARFAGHVVFCLVALFPRYGRSLIRTARPGVQAWRSILLFGASAFYFVGLRTVALPTASAIAFIGPIIVTALSVPMLGERVGPRRWAAVTIGFGGALIIIQPGSDVVQWGAIFVMLDALCYAFYQILSRKIGTVDPAAVSITLAGIGGFAISSAILPFSKIVLPSSLFDGLVFILLGLWGLLGHFFVIKAFQWGAASFVAPMGYGELVGSTLLGYFLFADFPDLWTWIGAATIVASGLYIAYREHKLQRLRRV